MEGKTISWKIVSQQEMTQPDAMGRYIKGVTVGFTTENGISGSVFVPDAQYSVDNVKKLVDARAQLMMGVQAINA